MASLIGSAVTIAVMVPVQLLVGRQMSKNSEKGTVRTLCDLFLFLFHNFSSAFLSHFVFG